MFDAIEKVPEDEISGFDFDGIDDQEGLFDMVNQEFTITEQLCPKEVSAPSLT